MSSLNKENGSTKQELLILLEDKLKLADDLLDILNEAKFNQVQGIQKLKRNIRQEKKFLSKFQGSNATKLKEDHVKCSNLTHWEAVVQELSNTNLTKAGVLQTYSWYRHSEGPCCKITVDVVGSNGLVWNKVIAGNPQRLSDNLLNDCCQLSENEDSSDDEEDSNWIGQGEQRNVLFHADNFLACSEYNQKNFKSPKVVFSFQKGVSQRVAKLLLDKGIIVKGEIVCMENEQSSNEIISITSCDQEITCEEETIDLLNLDITAMIAYVSGVTNGQSGFHFSDEILNYQAESERKKPSKPFLDKIFKDKSLICCESAMNAFQKIIERLGGTEETKRASKFIQRITVVEDRISDRLQSFITNGKIKERSVKIFGTGDQMRIPTLTANSGFVRAAKSRGVDLTVIFHESRALTEEKVIHQIEEINK